MKQLRFQILFLTLVVVASVHGLWVLYDYYKPFPEQQLNKKVSVTGVISSLPDDNGKSITFHLKTDNGLIKLYWSKRFGPSPPDFEPGQKWQLTVKLRQPHGFQNPGLFDYGQWLKRQGIKATGYVVTDQPSKLIDKNTSNALIEQFRYKIVKQLEHYIQNQQSLALAQSLILGDKSRLSGADRHLFQDTGTSHLIAISGLHVGLIFFWVFLLIRLIWSLSFRLSEKIPAQLAGMWVGLFAAVFYSLLAGFSVSTQRAVIMLGVFVVSRSFAYNLSARRVLSMAALCVLLWQPFSIISPGFWLSFLAVSFLVYALSARIGKQHWLMRWLYPQFVVIIALMPLTAYWFGSISLAAFITNLMAIPLVSFVIVPGYFIALLSTLPGMNIFPVITWFVQLLFLLLNWTSQYIGSVHLDHGFTIYSLVLAMVGMILIFLPKGFKLRLLGVIMLIPAVFVKTVLPSDVDIRMYVLDVGQGLAVVVLTKHYVLLYDTGPSFFSGSNAAEVVVVPFLKHLGIAKIDAVVVSHSDADHSGGFDSLYDRFQVNHVYASYDGIKEQIDMKKTHFTQCHEGVAFNVSQVIYQFLNPLAFPSESYSNNDVSCVLKISNPYHSVLLTGDIERVGEQYLMDYHYGQLASDVLFAPHHGSNSSSQAAFIDKVQPEMVLYSAGFQNRFGFPRQSVVKRYHQLGAKQLSTNHCGAIQIDIGRSIQWQTMQDECQLAINN